MDGTELARYLRLRPLGRNALIVELQNTFNIMTIGMRRWLDLAIFFKLAEPSNLLALLPNSHRILW
jgi:hypothetical protein